MATAEHWDHNYQGPGIARIGFSTSSHLIRRRFEIYRRLFSRAPGRDLLEVGCAPGDWLVTFAREFGLRPTGLDFAPSGCQAARDKVAAHGIEARVIEADYLKWSPGPQDRFDIVFFQGSLEHFPDAAAGLARVLPAMRPGALVAAQFPCLAPWHVNGWINGKFAPHELNDHHTRDLPQMESAFHSVGLTDVASERFGTLQLILSPQPEQPLPWQLFRGAIGFVDQVVTRVLDRTDLRVDLPFLSPQILTWGYVPR